MMSLGNREGGEAGRRQDTRVRRPARCTIGTISYERWLWCAELFSESRSFYLRRHQELFCAPGFFRLRRFFASLRAQEIPSGYLRIRQNSKKGEKI